MSLGPISEGLRGRVARGPARAPAADRRAGPAVTVHAPPTGPSLRAGPLGTHLRLALLFGTNYARKYYRETYLGLLWILIVPLLDVFLRSLLFGGFLGVAPGHRPYIVFLIVGSIGWYFFDRTSLWSYRALQYNRRFLREVPVPWLPAITGTVIPGLFHAGPYALIALGVCTYYKLTQGSFYVTFEPGTLYALLGVGMLVLYAWAIGLLFAPAVRVIRDVRLILRYVLSLWYLMTPVLYSVQTMPARYRPIVLVNPLTAPVELVRHGLLQSPLPTARSLVVSGAVLAVVLPVGLFLFIRAQSAAHARQ